MIWFVFTNYFGNMNLKCSHFYQKVHFLLYSLIFLHLSVQCVDKPTCWEYTTSRMSLTNDMQHTIACLASMAYYKYVLNSIHFMITMLVN